MHKVRMSFVYHNIQTTPLCRICLS